MMATSGRVDVTVGMSRTGRILIVAHTDLGENIRPSQHLETTRRESKQYEECTETLVGIAKVQLQHDY